MQTIIITRHPAAIEFIARELAKRHGGGGHKQACAFLGEVTAEDVAGKHVYGVLPLHLAALAGCVTCIEFAGTPPRGTEYTLTDMDAARARLVDYYVAIVRKMDAVDATS